MCSLLSLFSTTEHIASSMQIIQSAPCINILSTALSTIMELSWSRYTSPCGIFIFNSLYAALYPFIRLDVTICALLPPITAMRLRFFISSIEVSSLHPSKWLCSIWITLLYPDIPITTNGNSCFNSIFTASSSIRVRISITPSTLLLDTMRSSCPKSLLLQTVKIISYPYNDAIS